MAADPANASLWSYADVYVAPVGTAIPANVTTAFSGSWDQVGLLDGSDGFTESRSQDSKDSYAWGDILYKTARKNYKHTMKFSVVEDNPTTRALVYPGSANGEISVPVPARKMLAFETRDSEGKIRRLITRHYAQVDVAGDINQNESDPTKVQLVATIFPDADGVLFDEQKVSTITSIAITALTLALTASGNQIKKLLATATYADSTTGDISDMALWTSSAPTKATVADGYVTAVAAGTSNVSCSFSGVTATAPCVVTVS